MGQHPHPEHDPADASRWRYAPRGTLRLDEPRVMAILNVTPDSFSDGGTLATPAHAVEAARRAVAQGAEVLDIGGESTRPGAERVPAPSQIDRVVPALRAIRAALGPGPIITVDTTRAEVALAALDSGADAVNDVSAGLEDPGMLELVAQRACGLILMHRLAPPTHDRYSDEYARAPAYADVVGEVARWLGDRLAAARAAGIDPARTLLDPGLGFGKDVAQNLALIEGTPRLLELGRPILSGLSRKRFVARASGLSADSPPASRLPGTIALSVLHAQRGARLLRVHDVGPVREALAAWWSLKHHAGPGIQPAEA
jgi:dihydropteroate synthase